MTELTEHLKKQIRDAGYDQTADYIDQLEKQLAAVREWQPFETAPKDGNKFVALKVTIVDEYDDDYSRTTPIRKNVELIEPVLMQWVQFASFVKGEFMEIPHKIYRNPVRYIGWAPLPPQPSKQKVSA